MTSRDEPLDSSHQQLIDELCEQFKQNLSAGLVDIADLIARAPDALQNAAAEALLERYFARQLERGETIDERNAANQLGLGRNLVRRAKQVAMADARPQSARLILPRIERSRFRFVKELGHGGNGRVAQFFDELLGRDVAIKLPRNLKVTEESALALEEARAASSLNSPRVVPIHDVGSFWDDEPFGLDDPSSHVEAWRPAIVMDFASRRSLHDRMNRGAWSLDNLCRRFPEIAQCVGDVHVDELVHLDLKPANFLYGGKGQVLLTDFGWARRWIAGEPTRLGGTCFWMAPEALNRQPEDAHPVQDIWSLGVILYEMLTGRHPFRHDPDWRKQILRAEFEPVQDVHPQLDKLWQDVVHGCLQKDPGQRYQSVGELLAAFVDAVDQLGGPTYRRTATAARGGAGGHGGDGGEFPPDGPHDSDSVSESSRPGGSGFDWRAAELFVGREKMLGWLDGIFGDLDTNAPLLEPDDPALVAYLHAMPGSGKTYLIDRWLFLRQERAKEAGQADMASLVVDLPLDRKREYSAEDLRNELVAKLRLGGTNPEAELRAALQHRFLRIENVDSPEFGHAVAELASSLIGCRLIVSGRWFAEGSVPKRWRQQAVELLTPEQAAQLFAQEVGEEFWHGLTEDQREALTIRTARLPLAIHLGAGFLMKGTSVEKLLDRLPQLTLQDADDPRFGQSVLKIMFDELWKSLGQTLRNQPWLNADELLAGFRRMGFAHPAGVGRSLAAASSGLSEEDLDDLLVEAATLHLVELEPDSDRFRLHPLIAEQLTASVEQSPVDAAVTDWFCERLPEPEDQTVHNTAWHAMPLRKRECCVLTLV